jgi:hypothetical protein
MELGTGNMVFRGDDTPGAAMKSNPYVRVRVKRCVSLGA